MSKHYSEDDLTLYYYGEVPRSTAIEEHLRECAACATVYREISGTLSMIGAEEIPERAEHYGLEVWQRIRHKLPERESRFAWFTGFTRVAGLAAAAAVLVVAAFIAGRSSMDRGSANPGVEDSRTATVETPNPANPTNPTNPTNPRNLGSANRVLVGSVADHLDRSERVLTDIMNASNPGDISLEQSWAEDLITTSRLYRQGALDAGEQSIATVLDDLERNLLEVVHSPSKISAADLQQLRRRIDAAALLFKVRVMSDQLRDREAAPADRPAPRAVTSKIS